MQWRWIKHLNSSSQHRCSVSSRRTGNQDSDVVILVFFTNSSIKSAFWSSSFKRFYFKGEEELRPGKISGNNQNKEKSWLLSELVFSSWGQVCTDTGLLPRTCGVSLGQRRSDEKVEEWALVESTENTAAVEAEASTFHLKPICNCFNLLLNSLFWGKRWTLDTLSSSSLWIFCGEARGWEFERLVEEGVSVVTNWDFCRNCHRYFSKHCVSLKI